MSYPSGVANEMPVRVMILFASLALVAAACGTDSEVTTSSSDAPIDVATTSPSNTSPGAANSTSTTGGDIASPDDLLVIGSWGSGTLPQGAVAGAMSRYAEENPIAAIVTTGDNFFSDDHEFLMRPFAWAVESDIPFRITWGDSDVESQTRIKAVNTAFGDPPRWTVYRWGLVDLLILDSTQMDSQQQVDFLETALRESSAPTIVTFDHPAYSCVSEGPAKDILERWLPRFDDDVILVLNGHDHNYQRFDQEAGVTYLVTGGGGQSLTEVLECPASTPDLISSESTHHFLTMKQDGDLEVTAYDVNGQPLDEFTLDLP